MKTIQRTVDNITYVIQNKGLYDDGSIWRGENAKNEISTWGIAIKNDKLETIHEIYVAGSSHPLEYIEPKNRVLANDLCLITFPTKEIKFRNRFFRIKKGFVFSQLEESYDLLFEEPDIIKREFWQSAFLWLALRAMLVTALIHDAVIEIVSAFGRVFYKDWDFERRTRNILEVIQEQKNYKKNTKIIKEFINQTSNKVIGIYFLDMEVRPQINQELEFINNYELFRNL